MSSSTRYGSAAESWRSSRRMACAPSRRSSGPRRLISPIRLHIPAAHDPPRPLWVLESVVCAPWVPLRAPPPPLPVTTSTHETPPPGRGARRLVSRAPSALGSGDQAAASPASPPRRASLEVGPVGVEVTLGDKDPEAPVVAAERGAAQGLRRRPVVASGRGAAVTGARRRRLAEREGSPRRILRRRDEFRCSVVGRPT
jgi:hypothetical protein